MTGTGTHLAEPGRFSTATAISALLSRFMEARLDVLDLTPGISWHYNHYRVPKFDYGWHFHREYELVLITGGSGTRFVGDSLEPYAPGDLALIAPELPHTYASATASEGNSAIVVQFLPDFLGKDFFETAEFSGVSRLLSQASRGLRFEQVPPTIPTELAQLETLEFGRRTAALLGVLWELARNPVTHSLSSENFRPALAQQGRQRLDAVCRFLHTEYARPIQLPELAAVAHLSPAALSRFFHRSTGKTLTAYLTQIRLAAACRLLGGTDLAISQIAVRSGYRNLSHFNRQFRTHLGMSPRAYRQHMSEATQPSEAESAVRLRLQQHSYAS